LPLITVIITLAAQVVSLLTGWSLLPAKLLLLLGELGRSFAGITRWRIGLPAEGPETGQGCSLPNVPMPT
jgi:hypothetical protein